VAQDLFANAFDCPGKLAACPTNAAQDLAMPVRLLRALLAGLICTVSSSCGQLPGDHDRPPIELISGVEEMKAANDRLLNDVSLDRLSQLATHRDASIALAAAWRTLVRPLQSTVRSDQRLSYDCDLSSFSEVVRHRLPVEVPGWWETTIAKAHSHSTGTTFTFGSPWLYESDPNCPFVPHDVSIQETDEGFDLVVHGTPLHLSREVLKQVKQGGPLQIISPVVYGPAAFVVLADLHATQTLLVRIEIASGAATWERHVWCRSLAIWKEGTFHHFVEPRIGRDGNVYVFGCDGSSAYIEGFAANDGQPVLRFSSTY